MNLDTITLDKAAARQAFLEYRRAVRARSAAESRTREAREDEAIMRGYREIVRGRQILNVRDAILAGGFDDQHRPKLALCRANAKSVRVRCDFDGDVRFYADVGGDWDTGLKADRRPFNGLVTWPEPRFQQVRADAIVPIVPPSLRPSFALSGYDILFEADWRPRVAPRDPALLKRMGGDLYAVIAVWDLTELERAVIAGTRRRS